MESKMKTPSNFLKVLYSVIGFESILLISFGASGYVAFGSSTQEIITNNLTSLYAVCINNITQLGG